MIWNLIGSIGGKVLDIVEDKDEANRLKFLLQREPADEPMSVHYKGLLLQLFLKNDKMKSP